MSEKKNKNIGPSVDIRKVRPSNGMFNTTSIIISIVVSLVIFFIWNTVVGIQTKGEMVSLPEVVSVISEGKYTQVIQRDNLVIIETEEKKVVDGNEIDVKIRRHALIPSKAVFEQILLDSDIEYKSLKNIKYEPAMNISIIDILWLAFLAGGLFLTYNLIKGMQSSGGRIMDFGQSKARLIFGKKLGITFDEVAGISEVKEELVEIVDFLKNPKKYQEIGARIPKGVLLAGAPGTGKTLLAKAIAGEAGVPFFHTSGSEFEEMLVGAGASRVRDLFLKAKRAAPSIIFIDEIDAVAKKRGTVLHSGNGEQTLNQILVEMDGLEERENVIVLAATNRPDVLDPAILRPGRFDRSVTVRMPNVQDRKAILAVHSKNKKFEQGVDFDRIARSTVGYSGADLENLLNEAAIMAVKDSRKTINQSDLTESILKVGVGRKRDNINENKEELKRIAYHEAGHAVVAKFTKGSDPVELVSILSRGASGGVTVFMPEDDKQLTTKSEYIARITTGVSGKVAEEVFLGDMTNGASGDIEQITNLAKLMVRRLGMSDAVGFVKYGDLEETSHLGYNYGGGKDFSEKTAELIDNEIKRIIDNAQDSARKILKKYKKEVEVLVQLLLKQEEVSKEEFNAIFEK